LALAQGLGLVSWAGSQVTSLAHPASTCFAFRCPAFHLRLGRQHLVLRPWTVLCVQPSRPSSVLSAGHRSVSQPEGQPLRPGLLQRTAQEPLLLLGQLEARFLTC
jgi:hypothetical protein